MAEVTIVDCGIGNVRSVLRMFEHVDATTEIVSEHADEHLAKLRQLAFSIQ